MKGGAVKKDKELLRLGARGEMSSSWLVTQVWVWSVHVAQDGGGGIKTRHVHRAALGLGRLLCSASFPKECIIK